MIRRNFLKQASCAAIGSTTFLSTLYNLSGINAAAGYNNTTDYKALVCILLAGGNDSYNMLVPVGQGEYQEYAATRSNLALAQAGLLPLINGGNNNKTLGLHPALPNIQALYNSENLAFLSNVGSLVEPTYKENYVAGNACLPLGLFSHADEIAHWQTSTPYKREKIGWAGRMADVLGAMNSMSNISMNISMSGTNLYQTGNTVSPFSLTNQGSIGINGYDGPELLNQIKTSAIDSILSGHYDNLYQATYGDILTSSQESHEVYTQAISGLSELNTTFTPDNQLAQDLKTIAKTIAVRSPLNMNRQVFFVTYGGWDHHDEVLNTQAAMLSVLDEAIGQFDMALTELGVQDQVTTFSISDFGRTLTSNGNGTDHAWGGNHFIMGGAVKGKSIYGTYPDLYLDNSLDVGRGRLIPTTASDQYFAELALWFGVPMSQLDMVLPNIDTFYDVNATSPPLGFLL